jgi:hypothetical protein
VLKLRHKSRCSFNQAERIPEESAWDSLQAAQVADWIVGLKNEARGRDGIHEEGRGRNNSLNIMYRMAQLG